MPEKVDKLNSEKNYNKQKINGSNDINWYLIKEVINGTECNYESIQQGVSKHLFYTPQKSRNL